MKKIIVFGASGGTGKHIVEQALQEGYTVTAILRNPAGFAVQHENLKLVKGDVFQLSTFQNELQDQDAVVSCLGIPKIEVTHLYSEGMKNIVTAMNASGVKRIICISSGAIITPPGSSAVMSFLLKHILQRLFKPVYSDMQAMENVLKNSELNWTVMGAPKLTDGKKTKTYRVITRQALRSIPKISRADLADYILTHLTDTKTYKQRIEIAY